MAPKMPPPNPKTAPRRLQEAFETVKEASKKPESLNTGGTPMIWTSAPVRFRYPSEASRWLQDGQRGLQESAKTAPRAPKSAPRAPPESPKRPCLGLPRGSAN
eukprot:2901680-Pyramimonas_sp.AAC.1